MRKAELLKKHSEPITNVNTPYIVEEIIREVASNHNITTAEVKRIFISQFYALRLILNNADVWADMDENLSIRLINFGSFYMSPSKKEKNKNKIIKHRCSHS